MKADELKKTPLGVSGAAPQQTDFNARFQAALDMPDSEQKYDVLMTLANDFGSL